MFFSLRKQYKSANEQYKIANTFWYVKQELPAADKLFFRICFIIAIGILFGSAMFCDKYGTGALKSFTKLDTYISFTYFSVTKMGMNPLTLRALAIFHDHVTTETVTPKKMKEHKLEVRILTTHTFLHQFH